MILKRITFLVLAQLLIFVKFAGASEPQSVPTHSFYVRGGPNDQKMIAVVFVHGLFGNDSTWGNKETSLVHLTATDKDLEPYVSPFLFEFESPYMRKSYMIPELALRLYTDLDEHRVFQAHQKLIFVAHSMGGIIVRELLIAHPELVPRVQMMYFYGVPTNGAELAEVGEKISLNPQLRGLVPIDANDFLTNMTFHWMGSENLKRIPTYCGYEKADIVPGLKVVSPSSAWALCTEVPDPLEGDHMQVVKPTSAGDERFTRLLMRIKRVISGDIGPCAKDEPRVVKICAPANQSRNSRVRGTDGCQKSPFQQFFSAGALIEPTTVTYEGIDLSLQDGQEGYAGSFMPSSRFATVTYQFSKRTEVHYLEVIQHKNGILKIRGYLGDDEQLSQPQDSLGEATSAYGVRLSPYKDGSPDVFAFPQPPGNPLKGLFLKMIVTETNGEFAWGTFRMIPLDANRQRILPERSCDK